MLRTRSLPAVLPLVRLLHAPPLALGGVLLGLLKLFHVAFAPFRLDAACRDGSKARTRLPVCPERREHTEDEKQHKNAGHNLRRAMRSMCSRLSDIRAFVIGSRSAHSLPLQPVVAAFEFSVLAGRLLKRCKFLQSDVELLGVQCGMSALVLAALQDQSTNGASFRRMPRSRYGRLVKGLRSRPPARIWSGYARASPVEVTPVEVVAILQRRRVEHLTNLRHARVVASTPKRRRDGNPGGIE